MPLGHSALGAGTLGSGVGLFSSPPDQVEPTVTSVAISPSSAAVQGGGTRQFAAVATGTNNPSQTFTWSTTLGQISASGLFTAPVATGAAQTGTVTVTSTLNPNAKATATFTVPALVVVDPPIDPPVGTSGAPGIFASTIMSVEDIYLSTVMI